MRACCRVLVVVDRPAPIGPRTAAVARSPGIEVAYLQLRRGRDTLPAWQPCPDCSCRRSPVSPTRPAAPATTANEPRNHVAGALEDVIGVDTHRDTLAAAAITSIGATLGSPPGADPAGGAVTPGAHPDPVDPQQSAVEDDERLGLDHRYGLGGRGARHRGE